MQLMFMTEEMRLKKAHVALMRHPETALYAGVMMMGESEVVDSEITAYTDGVNKKYGRKFLSTVCRDQLEVNGLVLHENLHVALRQLIHNRDLFKENRKLANMAADYVVNGIIMSIQDKNLVKLPKGGLYDMRFVDMSMREVYRILKEESESGDGGGGDGGDGGGSESGGSDYEFDEHDINGDASEEDVQKMSDDIDRALREGALLAGRLGVDIPRAVKDALKPTVNWREALRDFVSASCRGKDEYTWRKFNRRMLANDLYLPSVENETIGEVLIAIDTSGSIGQQQINEFATELSSICESVEPDMVRVLWWDTKVHGEQKFTSQDYGRIGSLLKPKGGGGTRVSSVSDYINKNKISAECVIVFTDGYLESNVTWSVSSPTLWLVTANRSWTPPSGKSVNFQ